MVSVKNGNHQPPADAAPEPDGVYQLYLAFKTAELAWFLSRPAVAGSGFLQEQYQRLCAPEPAEAFFRRLAAMPADERRRYEARLAAGYRAAMSDDARVAREAADLTRLTPPEAGDPADPEARALTRAAEALLRPPTPPPPNPK